MYKKDKSSLIGDMPMPDEFPYRSVYIHGRSRHEKYDDFWRKHPPMDITHRAKIFAPFDALAGFSECVSSKEILYQEHRSLSEGEKEELDRKVSVLRNLTINGKTARESRPKITVRYFVPCMDSNSSSYGSGGTYNTLTGICQKVDEVSRTITIDDQILAIDDITDIKGV